MKNVSVQTQRKEPEPNVVMAPISTVAPIVRAEYVTFSARVTSLSASGHSWYMCARCTVKSTEKPITMTAAMDSAMPRPQPMMP